MATTNPKLQGYILPNLHQRFTAWKKERHLEKDSQALNTLLSEFFGEAIPAVETADSQRLLTLENTVKSLSQQLEALTQTVAAIQSTPRLPSDSSHSTSLSDASNKAVAISESSTIQSELPLLELQQQENSTNKAPDESVSDSLPNLSLEQSEVTDQTSESAIAPAQTYRFANLEETITPVVTSNGYCWRSREGFLWDNAYEP